ncbi:hypothetical protein R1sor_002318 [Riccia sorocarpa]|uniref:Myb/SANT-like DNA-binding domain-containing protein n=1 Tax=Riccia sorocarpa TaxID=122646 RepID=A0ABD3H2M2_9MARC
MFSFDIIHCNWDNFDTSQVHAADRSGVAPMPEGEYGGPSRNQQHARQPVTGNVTIIGRKQWESWQAEALLECKKAEAEELENLVGREQMLKWKRIHIAMLEKGVQADPSQIRNKWKSIFGNYKKVEDRNNQSGAEPYTYAACPKQT